MNAKICDYCGAFYVSEMKSATISGHGVYGHLFGINSTPVRLDFCQKCAEELRGLLSQWWSEREEKRRGKPLIYVDDITAAQHGIKPTGASALNVG